jgi:diguanylate cyclase (GGDEF)-like protein
MSDQSHQSDQPDRLERDALTRAVARGDFEKLVEWEVERARPGRRPLTVALLDLDGWGKVSERLGPALATQFMKRIADVLRASTREGDVLARDDGDQFLLLMPDMPPERGLIMLEDLRRLLANSTFNLEHEGSTASAQCTFSCGLASFPADGTTREALLRSADAALFDAKSGGRNRICMAARERMVLKSNYYSESQLSRLARLARALGRTEASLLREALQMLFERHESVLKGHA